MRPDTFTELIRRKLESIRPDVTERDWTRMQSSLQQAGLSGPSGVPVAGAGSVSPWLLAVGGIGIAALLSVTIWQRAEINTLHNRLLQQTTASAQAIAPATPNNSQGLATATPTPDTVYITRYVPVERMNGRGTGRLDQSGSVSPTITPVPSVSGNQPATISSPSAFDTNQLAGNSIPATDAPTVSATQPDHSLSNKTLTDKALPNGSPSSNTLPDNGLSERATRTGQQRLALTGEPGKSEKRNSRPKTNALNQSQPIGYGTIQAMTPAETVSSSADASGDAAASLDNEVAALMTTRSLLSKSINWNARLARRMPRPVGTVFVISQSESGRTTVGAGQSVAKPATSFRFGVSSDLQTKYRNAGIVAETVLGGHWVLSTGMTGSSQLLGSYVTDDDYDYQTRQSFRREFAPTSDPRRDIYGVEIRSFRYQIPVTLGYRIGLGHSLSLLPSLGTYLDLNNRVQVSFSYRKPLRQGFDRVDLQNDRSHNLINTYTAGAALEWQQAHWVVQGGLLYTRPLYSDKNDLTTPALGERLRLLYQF